ncbi:Mrp51 [Kluyveromyces lactis]|nr:Mrp51 [Kluyveromyces lactis]
MSHISNLLRNSRIAQVAKTDKPLFRPGNSSHPTHQVIETKPSSLYRQEWGLKASIPSKIKTRYLVYNDLDTQQRLTTFEPMGQYQWNRIRFQEMGLAPRYVEEESNPLFNGKTKRAGKYAPFSNAVNIAHNSAPSEKTRKLKEIVQHRSEFKKWLLEKHPDSIAGVRNENTRPLKALATEFLHEKMGKLNINTAANSEWNIVGTGGLTYNLKGRLRQSPNGVKQKHVVPGRVLSVQGPDRAVAVGGFIAEAKSVGRNPRALQYNMGDFVRQEVLPFAIEDPKVEGGNVTLSASLVEPRNDFSFAQKIGLGQNRSHYTRSDSRNSSRKTVRSVTAEESRSQSEEFLNLLKTTM